jgi:hypothetical protein
MGGQMQQGRQAIERSVKQAKTTGAYLTEVECRLDLARALLLEHRPQDALSAIKDIPPDGDRVVGRELQARIEYWRARILSAEGRSGVAESGAAQELIEDLSNSLPAEGRTAFLARPDIALIQHSAVR